MYAKPSLASEKLNVALLSSTKREFYIKIFVLIVKINKLKLQLKAKKYIIR